DSRSGGFCGGVITRLVMEGPRSRSLVRPDHGVRPAGGPAGRLLALRPELPDVGVPARPDVPRLDQDEPAPGNRPVGGELAEPVELVRVAADRRPPGGA